MVISHEAATGMVLLPLAGACTEQSSPVFLLLQLAKLFVLMYPRQPSVAALAHAVDAIIKEDQAQQGTKPRVKQ